VVSASLRRLRFQDRFGNLVGPEVDGRPISKVAIGRPDRPHDESLSKAELILVELADKRSVAAGTRSANELGEVSRCAFLAAKQPRWRLRMALFAASLFAPRRAPLAV
jgi:hypothetical protein